MAAPNLMPPQILPILQQAALPSNPYDQVIDTSFYDAYQCCLEAEIKAGGNSKRLVYARCVGYLLLEAPSHEARVVIADEIIECHEAEEDIGRLGSFYVNHLFRLFRQQKGKTPAPSEHPSRPSFHARSDNLGASVIPAPRDRSAAKAAALKRDNFRCMVTGFVNRNVYLSASPVDRQALNLHVNPGMRGTNFCHIFPPSTDWNLNPQQHGHPTTKYSGSMWSIVNGFGSIDVLQDLDCNMIHRLSNGLTMWIDLHELFDQLMLWFEEVPNQPHTYNVRLYLPDGTIPQPHVVTFTTTDPTLELPDPHYLRLHAAICKVAHMSGAAGYLDLLDRDVEENGVLAGDGSSAGILAHHLRRVKVV